MRARFALRVIAMACAACAATGAAAVWLGRAQGLPVAGQPLDLTVPLVPETATDGAPDCVQAQVFQGEVRMPADRTQVEVVPAGAGSAVRIRTADPITEPLLQLYLHFGCQQAYTRRLVVVTQAPPERVPEAPPVVAPPAAAPAPAPMAAVVGPAPDPGPAPAPRPRRAAPVRDTASASSTPDATAAARNERAAPAPTRPAAPPAPAARAEAAAPSRAVPVPAVAGSAGPVLRLSHGLVSVAGSAEQRAAAAALWRALNASPEDVLRNAQRVAALEGELTRLRQSLQQQQEAARQAEAALRTSELLRVGGGVAYARAARGLLAGAGAFCTARRSRRAGGAEADPATVMEGEPGGPSAPAEAAAPALDDQSAQLRHLRTVELQDVQQEVDFFLARGQHAQALDVLRQHIERRPDTSLLAWLNLMDVQRRLGLRDAFGRSREELRRQKRVRVPGFDGFAEIESPGLEGDVWTMAKVTAGWPSRQVLALLEECLFRAPGEDGKPAFTLDGYRDLVLLHQVGSELVEQGLEESGSPAAGDAIDDLPDLVLDESPGKR